MPTATAWKRAAKRYRAHRFKGAEAAVWKGLAKNRIAEVSRRASEVAALRAQLRLAEEALSYALTCNQTYGLCPLCVSRTRTTHAAIREALTEG